MCCGGGEEIYESKKARYNERRRSNAVKKRTMRYVPYSPLFRSGRRSTDF
jgi:hypothetical protein